MAKHFEWYTVGELGKMEICFPEDKVCCLNCELLYTDSTNRLRCTLRKRLIFEPYDILSDCPIEFKGKKRGFIDGKTII